MSECSCFIMNNNPTTLYLFARPKQINIRESPVPKKSFKQFKSIKRYSTVSYVNLSR